MPEARCSTVLAWSLAVALSGCASRPPVTVAHCAAGSGLPTLTVMLFFGRSIPGGGQVSEQDWDRFVQNVVTPALPNGFTAMDASGSWLSPAGHATRHEATKLLLVSLPDSPGAMAPVQKVRAAYQARFHQQLVGMIVAPGCASF